MFTLYRKQIYTLKQNLGDEFSGTKSRDAVDRKDLSKTVD